MSLCMVLCFIFSLSVGCGNSALAGPQTAKEKEIWAEKPQRSRVVGERGHVQTLPGVASKYMLAHWF